MSDLVVRLRIRCRGAVQGVGFRPTVHRIATAAGLAGWVVNDPGGATVEVEGPEPAVAAFPDRLRSSLPPLARLDGMEVAEIPPVGDAAFVVRDSRDGRRAGALVPPDAALCHDCRRELEDPRDRRHAYPFITCTNCGPRFSLVHRLPYDRPATSMACFPMCPACEREYTDPGDRRFHAEPVCCADCGPQLRLLDAAAVSSSLRGPRRSWPPAAPCSRARWWRSRASAASSSPAAPTIPPRCARCGPASAG